MLPKAELSGKQRKCVPAAQTREDAADAVARRTFRATPDASSTFHARPLRGAHDSPPRHLPPAAGTAATRATYLIDTRKGSPLPSPGARA